FYSEEVWAELQAYHDPRYAGFSKLIRGTFDAALKQMHDGEIDLLYIVGLHTYEAVKHDFENCLPKMSERGIILFHDCNVREGARQAQMDKLKREVEQLQAQLFEYEKERIRASQLANTLQVELESMTDSKVWKATQLWWRFRRALFPKRT